METGQIRKKDIVSRRFFTPQPGPNPRPGQPAGSRFGMKSGVSPAMAAVRATGIGCGYEQVRGVDPDLLLLSGDPTTAQNRHRPQPQQDRQCAWATVSKQQFAVDDLHDPHAEGQGEQEGHHDREEQHLDGQEVRHPQQGPVQEEIVRGSVVRAAVW